MNGRQKVLLAVSAMIFAGGAYAVFVQGEIAGVAVMAMAMTVFAVSRIQSKNAGDDADAG